MDNIFNIEMSPIFEAYGKACYLGQNLESSFRFLLVLNASKSDKDVISKSAIESVETATSQLTLNKLFRLAQEKEYFTNKEISILIRANQMRNYVIHNYWSNNINLAKLTTPEGRLSLKADLESIAAELRAADQITVSLIDNYLIEAGITTEILKVMVTQIYEEGSVDIPKIKH